MTSSTFVLGIVAESVAAGALRAVRGAWPSRRWSRLFVDAQTMTPRGFCAASVGRAVTRRAPGVSYVAGWPHAVWRRESAAPASSTRASAGDRMLGARVRLGARGRLFGRLLALTASPCARIGRGGARPPRSPKARDSSRSALRPTCARGSSRSTTDCSHKGFLFEGIKRD